ncbi:MAG: hypothetical protein LBJ82_04880, partial [Deltaproteobacteria bacterium]|nr:hypothetical protein [Deltaproteobacteria bacterium]
DISRRQEERLAFRATLLQKIWKEKPPTPPAQDHLKNSLSISEDVAQRLEKRRILRSDIALVLSREDATLFRQAQSGRRLAALRPRQVTFWVEYSLTEEGGYLIHDAYCHRMVVPGIPDDPAGPLSGLANLSPDETEDRCCKDATGCGSQKKV